MPASDLTYAAAMRADGMFPAVLRFASMNSRDAFGMLMHGERRGGNLDHVDRSRSHLNRTIIGASIPDPSTPGKMRCLVAEELVNETRKMAEFNLSSNIVGLSKLGRKKDLAIARRRGIQDPWNAQKKSRGPHREVVLTLHRDWFRADENTPADRVLQFLDDEGLVARFDMAKVERFISAGTEFLTENFGDQMRYLRVDFDEQSIHFQGLLVGREQVEPSARYAHGRHIYSMTKHPLIGHEIDAKGRISRRGYEVAQDAIGEFFSRPEYRDMNIVRGEARAAKKREAMAAAYEAREAAEAASLFEGEAEIPDGSPNAQRMFLLRQAMAEKVAEKGSADRVRTDDRQILALDYLEALGVVSSEARHEASTRRARAKLLEVYQTDYGTAAEIIDKPEAVSEKVIARARARVIAEKEAADRERKSADEAARIERERLDREAAERREAASEKASMDEIRREKKFAMKEASLIEREENVTAREVEVERKIGWLNATLKELQGLGDAIRGAAQRIGILDAPWVQSALAAGRRVREISTGSKGQSLTED